MNEKQITSSESINILAYTFETKNGLSLHNDKHVKCHQMNTNIVGTIYLRLIQPADFIHYGINSELTPVYVCHLELRQ